MKKIKRFLKRITLYHILWIWPLSILIFNWRLIPKINSFFIKWSLFLWRDLILTCKDLIKIISFTCKLILRCIWMIIKGIYHFICFILTIIFVITMSLIFRSPLTHDGNVITSSIDLDRL